MSRPDNRTGGEFRLIASTDDLSAEQFFVRAGSIEPLDATPEDPGPEKSGDTSPTHRIELFAVDAGYFLDWTFELDPADRTSPAHRPLDRSRLHIIYALLSRHSHDQSRWIDWLGSGTWHYLEFGSGGAPAVLAGASSKATHYISYLGPVTGAEGWELSEAFSPKTRFIA